MDILSLTCNISAVLTIASQLISVGYSYESSVADFPREVQKLTAELTSMSGILSTLRTIIDQPPTYYRDRSANAQPSLLAVFLSSPLEECGESLRSFLQSLEDQKKGSGIKKLFKRIIWPLKEEDTKSFFAKLERHKKLFSLALSADEVALARLIYDDIGEMKKTQRTEIERKELAAKDETFRKIIKWLSPADIEFNHAAARQLQQAGTGKWFTEGDPYRNWLLPDHSFLWLHGKAGAGKTILSSIIIDHVMSQVYTSPNSAPAVTYFYCDFKDSSKRTAVGLFGSLVAQLVQKLSVMPNDLESLYHLSNSGNKPPEICYLEESLHSLIKQFSKVVVIIDAFDECLERVPVFEGLKRLMGININLLITSRDEFDIKLQFTSLPDLLIDENDTSVDIERFVTSELIRQPRLNGLKHSTKSDIISSLVGGANGMFRWVKCCLDEILKLRSDKAIKSALKSLPPTLESTYERILCNIPEGDRVYAVRIFQWLVSSQRPMKLREVVDAIAVEVGELSMSPDSRLNDPEDIKDICGNLIDLNPWNMTLGLAHFTVAEYLKSTGIAQSPAAAYQIQTQKANIELTKICLTYVLFSDFNTGPCKTEDEFLTRLDEYPLLCYAPYHWPNHVSNYESGSDGTLDDLILSFFHLGQDSANFLSWLQIRMAGPYHKSAYMNEYKRRLVTPVYLAAEMGQLSAVKDLFENGTDINVIGGSLGTPLVIAANEGHLKTVQFLLEKGAGLDKNTPNRYKPLHDPLEKASQNGFAECVQILLDYGAEDPPEWIKCCARAIGAVFISPHESVMKVFLKTDYYKQVPSIEEADNPRNMHPFLEIFMVCAHHGWEGGIRSLWEIGSDILISANENKMFLLCLRAAALYGHVKFLKIVLQNDEAKAYCAKNGIYRLLMQEATYYGQDKIVEFLLGFMKSPGADDIGISLHVAAAKGQIDIIERLLRAGANPLHKDGDGWSPSIYASQYGEHGALEKLSVSADVPEAFDTRPGPISWDFNPDKVHVDGTKISAKTFLGARASHPINPFCANYSFEVEIVKSACSIGFADALHNLTADGNDTFERVPGRKFMSWGYSYRGKISFDNRSDVQKAEGFGTGDIVGCHFDRIKNLAFFTVNGRIIGKPIADVKGKLIPQISLEAEACIRTNFGERPLAYPMPNLSVETLSDTGGTWKSSDAWWSLGFRIDKPEPFV